jgi:hypothetical protein
MVILTKFLDFVMFGTKDLGHNGVKLKKNLPSPQTIIYAENNLSKLQFNFAHFIGPILTLREPTSLFVCFESHEQFFSYLATVIITYFKRGWPERGSNSRPTVC